MSSAAHRSTILAGGPQAIIALLLAGIAGLFVELRRMRGEISKKDDRIDHIVDQYHAGTISMTEALNALKLVLSELRAKL